MIKVGTNVKSKIHDDLTGHVVICEPINNYAVIMTDIIDYEMMTVECYLSDLELVSDADEFIDLASDALNVLSDSFIIFLISLVDILCSKFNLKTSSFSGFVIIDPSGFKVCLTFIFPKIVEHSPLRLSNIHLD